MKKNEQATLLMLKEKSHFMYRSESEKFDLSFKMRNLDVKFLVGGYLSGVRVKFAKLTQKHVAKGAGISTRNLINIENGYGTSIDVILRVYLYYVCIGVLSDEQQEQFSDLFRNIWEGE